jgi:hypothetical protein
MRANIRDRAGLERFYPRADFETEAQANRRGDAAVLKGLRIDSMPDENGAFDVVRAARQIGEADNPANSLFLCPYAQGDRALDYGGFLDKIIAAAESAQLDRSPGPGDARLRGPRQ